MDRKAVVAGHFYAREKDALLEMLKQLIPLNAAKKSVLGVVLPHAGFSYSGGVVGKTIASIQVPDKIIILGPNHTGQGQPYSLVSSGVWNTPLGEIEIDADLAGKLLAASSLLIEDETAHIYEHSIEVILPFIQFINPRAKIIPVVISDFKNEGFKKVGEDIAKVISESSNDVLIIASTDFTHYEPQPEAEKKDAAVIEAIVGLNPDKMLEIVQEQKISMCGFGPVSVMLNACKLLQAKNGKLIQYQTSGDISGDYDSVVGYAGIVIH